jgi:U3 small nucleolar RNA-associated protein 12
LQVFYLNTMKWFVDLYGHKLPALTLDISSDSTLLVSGSADKNIKIWGLDFGDCHKSLFAHQDSVMAVAFVSGTHYVFTAGKDHMVKYWDADKFELLLELPAHHGEVCSLGSTSHQRFSSR